MIHYWHFFSSFVLLLRVDCRGQPVSCDWPFNLATVRASSSNVVRTDIASKPLRCKEVFTAGELNSTLNSAPVRKLQHLRTSQTVANQLCDADARDQ